LKATGPMSVENEVSWSQKDFGEEKENHSSNLKYDQ